MDMPEEPEWIFPLEGMLVGSSFFIPTLRPSELIYVVDTRSKECGVRIKAYTRIESGYLGIRVWRIR
jgi:hypothetical protein